jgi:four helix bundle protein
MTSRENSFFHHERLEVYRESITFVAWLAGVLEQLSRLGDIKGQLERASSSIALNIAEGNGKYSARDRCRFFDIAHGSALECAAALDVLVARSKLTEAQVRAGKESLQRIVRMLLGLMKRNPLRHYDRRMQSSDPLAHPAPAPYPVPAPSAFANAQRPQ